MELKEKGNQGRQITVSALQFACSWNIDENIATAERVCENCD